MRDDQVISYMVDEAERIGIKHLSLEGAISLALRESVQVTSALPDDSPVRAKFGMETFWSPPVPPVIQPQRYDRADATAMWWSLMTGRPSPFAPDDAQCRRLAYLMCCDLAPWEIGKMVGLPSARVSHAYAMCLGSVASHLWRDPAIREQFPLHVRIPDVFFVTGEHHAAATPASVYGSISATSDRWKGLVAMPIPQWRREAEETLDADPIWQSALSSDPHKAGQPVPICGDRTDASVLQSIVADLSGLSSGGVGPDHELEGS